MIYRFLSMSGLSRRHQLRKRQHRSFRHRSAQRSAPAGVLLTISAIALTCSTASFAQNEDKVKVGLAAWRNSGCADCHGAFANGEKERDEPPNGADLRRARLMSNADPIFAAIEARQKASHDYEAARLRFNAELKELGSVRTEDAPSCDDYHDAQDRDNAAVDDVLSTMPTTLDGVIAKIGFMTSPRYQEVAPDAWPQTVIGEVWNGYDGQDAAAQWFRNLELALRRIAAGMPSA